MSGNASAWAGASSIVGDVLNFGGGLIQGARNRRAQRKENKRQREWASEMFERQNERDIAFWQMQNAYNDPAAQMQRLKDAGLNPNLVYGSGADATAGPIATHSAPTPNTKAETYENMFAPLANTASNYLAIRQQQANIRRTEAEARAIDERNVEQMFNNELMRQLGVESYVKNQGRIHDSLELSYQKQLSEYEAWRAGSFESRDISDPNSPIAKAIRAGYYQTVVEAENAVKLGAIRDLEKTIKTFQANLAKQGIDPNTPWYGKILVDMLSKIAGRPIMDLIIDPNTFKNQ